MSVSIQADALRLSSPMADVGAVNAKTARLLARLDILTVGDLLRHLPMRYEHEAAERTIKELAMGVVGSARGLLTDARWVPGFQKRRGRFEATIEDDSAQLLLTWFNASYLRDKLHPGLTIRAQGKTKLYKGQMQMTNPRWQILDENDQPPARDERLRPVYSATEDLRSWQIEKLIDQILPAALEKLTDPLPEALLKHNEMPPLAKAFAMAHRPDCEDDALTARRRLAFNELILLQLGIAMKRAYVSERLTAPALRYSAAIDKHIRQRFAFKLTESQSKVLSEIADDLSQTRPMNRLLQGDVGSGKTVVALYALLMAVADDCQGALMAPTELLAEQHYASIAALLAGSNVRVSLLTGTVAASNGHIPGGSADVAKPQLLQQIAGGKIDIVIGTHALLSEAVRFANLAVAVIDEQHRFGVLQRAAFRLGVKSKGAKSQVPHHLVMTATPIPRTLSLTVFGDLDISTITELPPGRTPIVSRVVAPDQATEVYSYLTKRLDRGEQAYVVVPAIDDTGRETSTQLKNVTQHARLLQEKYCHGFKVAAVHGRLQAQTRAKIMERFRRGEIQVLVATTVIEVGVDVPQAMVMIIEHAERFGLAQLHQLRGRVGRSSNGQSSLCVFISDPTTDDARKRMNAIASTVDGFKIAELDLEIRGMGDFFGTRQSGLPPLRVARIPHDMDLLMLARRDAQKIIKADPLLAGKPHQLLRRVLLQQYGEALGLIDVG